MSDDEDREPTTIFGGVPGSTERCIYCYFRGEADTVPDKDFHQHDPVGAATIVRCPKGHTTRIPWVLIGSVLTCRVDACDYFLKAKRPAPNPKAKAS